MFPNGASSPKSPLRDEKASLARREGYFTLRLTSDPFILTPCASSRATAPGLPRVGGCVPPRGSQRTPPAHGG